MNAMPERDFSNMAYLRGAAASALCAYLLFGVAYPALLFGRNVFELDTLLSLLGNTFLPVNLLTGAVFFSAAASVGLVVLTRSKRDHTTFAAAARAGAITAALVIGLLCLFGLAPGFYATLTHRPEELLTPDYWSSVTTLIWIGCVVIASGALSGLMFRTAAGAPTVEHAPA